MYSIIYNWFLKQVSRFSNKAHIGKNNKVFLKGNVVDTTINKDKWEEFVKDKPNIEIEL